MTEGLPAATIAGGTGESAAGARRAALSRLAVGVVVMLAAVVVFAGSRLVASGQSHSYDAGATPPVTVRLTAGKQYQLSSPTGVPALQRAGLLTNLACTWSTDGDVQNPLTITTTMTDDRDLRTFATFSGPATGPLRIGCAGIDKVFIDDADDSGTDRSALLVLLTVAVGLLGVLLAVSGWYQLIERVPPAYHDAELFDRADGDEFDDEFDDDFDGGFDDESGAGLAEADETLQHRTGERSSAEPGRARARTRDEPE